jgi:cellulose synthase/poly-beta-1,6-N-acetylglucosamine synthase-like glycosyltransferase
MFAGAASFERGSAGLDARAQAPVPDRLLPTYSIVIALHREACVVRLLAAALDALDYPRGKLDIKLVIEEDDAETHRALAALDLPAAMKS